MQPQTPPTPTYPTIAVTGGGSGGHTSAAAGILAALQQAGVPGKNLCWIGSHKGVEGRAAAQQGITFYAVSSGKLRRYLSFENLTDLPRILAGGVQSLAILRRRRPAVVISTGGFVSLPVAVAAWLLRIPLLVHEQTLVPGLANRVAARLARQVLLTFPESAVYFGPQKCVTTGNPLRPELTNLPDPAAAHSRLGLLPSLPLLYVTGGAQGSNALNRTVAGALPRLLERWQVIHQYGTLKMEFDGARLEAEAARLDPALRPRYRLAPYLGKETVDIFAAAQVMVSRAGAATINEIIQLGLAAVLIPYPDAVAHEQERMARKLEAAAAARVIDQSDLTPESLLACLGSLAPADLDSLRQHARLLAPPDVERRLADTILAAAAPTRKIG